MSSKPEGDSKLQELRRLGQSLCGQDLEEPEKQEVQQKVQGAEEQWTRVLQNAKQALEKAEKQCALQSHLKDYEALRENTRAWLQDKQQRLDSLDSQKDPEKMINTAQVSLNNKTIKVMLSVSFTHETGIFWSLSNSISRVFFPSFVHVFFSF